jgi:hypothetical protein
MTQETIMRQLRDANPAPDLARPADADEQFARIVAQPGDPRLTLPRRPPIRERLGALRQGFAARTAILMIGATAMAAVIVAVTQAGSPTTAQARVLYRLAADSAKATPFTGRYVILPETDTYGDLPGQTEKITSVDDTRTGADTVYSSNLDLRDGTPAMRRAWRKELGVVGVDALIDPVPFLYPEAWYASLPTDPTALRAKLLPIGVFVVSQQLGTVASTAAVKAALNQNHGSISAATSPTSAAVREDDIYEAASDLLRSPLVQPVLRSALYKVLATTSGVSVDAHATDPAGRPAIAMSRRYSQNGEQLQSITYEDPTTGAVLAQTSSQYGANAPVTGTSTAIYQPVTSTNSMPANPYGH